MVNIVVLQLFRMYEKLSSTKLQSYATFFKSKTGKKISISINSEYLAIFKVVGSDLADEQY
jgi:hypothetical protein